MNKAELVELMSEKSNESKASCERSLDLVLDSILIALAKGQDVSLIGFGSFRIKHRPTRKGVNPQTGNEIKINAYNQPIFRAGKKMKAACN